MSPTQQNTDSTLFEEARKLRSLRSAWRTVRARALSSKSPATKKEAAAIEADPERYLNRLQKSIGRKDFAFAPQRGVAKKRSGKTRRPLVIAPVSNRIVQRAILDVCQSDRPRLRKRLGKIPALIATPTSVGGLPEKGVNDAATLILKSISDGAKWYVRSDIKDFFTRIQKSDLEAFIRENISDSAFIELFLTALKVDLENRDEVNEWLSLFPSDDLGVAQGSSLSALCANIALRGFDAELNGRQITTIRYLDDFVILGRTKSATTAAWKNAKSILSTAGFAVHEPTDGGAKAGEGKIADGFEFLSLRFDEGGCRPTKGAKAKLLLEIDDVIKSAKADINANAGELRGLQPRYAQTLVLLDRKTRGWGDAFRCSTNRLGFHQLDREIDKRLVAFAAWWEKRANSLEMRERRRGLGVSLLGDIPKLDPLISPQD